MTAWSCSQANRSEYRVRLLQPCTICFSALCQIVSSQVASRLSHELWCSCQSRWAMALHLWHWDFCAGHWWKLIAQPQKNIFGKLAQPRRQIHVNVSGEQTRKCFPVSLSFFLLCHPSTGTKSASIQVRDKSQGSVSPRVVFMSVPLSCGTGSWASFSHLQMRWHHLCTEQSSLETFSGDHLFQHQQ